MAKRKTSVVTVQCAACGEDMTRYPSEIKASATGRFFHGECRSSGVGFKPRKGTERACESCGETFYAAPRNKGQRFCSTRCVGRGNAKPKDQIDCAHCGKSFEASPSKKAKYCSVSCSRAASLIRAVPGETHNGRPVRLHSEGYRMLYEPNHHSADVSGWVHEHRWVAIEQLNDGAPLPEGYEVHHINGDHQDNRPENLQIMTVSEHRSHHMKERRQADKRDQAMADFLRSNPDLLAAFEASRLG